ncbi:MAG TPA: PAS domain S-box protein, partial [Gemmatimonadales bacterium]|nr:PAS domain S-box protein [Gemmatimonadales bacterium]
MATQLLPDSLPFRSKPLISGATTPAGFVGQLLVLTAACAVSTFAGARLFGVFTTAPMLPSIGVAIAGLLLLGAWYFPGVFVGVVIGYAAAEGRLTSLVPAMGHTAVAVVPALLLPRLGWRDLRFERLREVLRYLLIAGLLGPLVGTAILMAPFLMSDDYQFWVSYPVVVFAGCAVSALLIGPLVLTWLGPTPTIRAKARWVEYLVVLGGLVLAAMLSHQSVQLYFITIFPLLAWAALRTGPRGAVLMSCALFAVCTWAAHLELADGPLGTEQRLLLGGLNVTQGITSLLLATSVIERRRANRDERSIEDAYRTLVASAPFAVVGVDREGKVTVWSNAAERLFGWTAADVMGRRLPTIPDHRHEEFHRLLTHQAVAVHDLETVRRRRDGREIDIALTAWPIYDSEGRLQGTMEAYQDITERKRASRLQQATYRISEAALAALDLPQLYAAIHQIVAGLMPARNLSIALYEPEADRLSFAYWADERATAPVSRPAGKGLTEYVIRSGRPLRGRAGLVA